MRITKTIQHSVKRLELCPPLSLKESTSYSLVGSAISRMRHGLRCDPVYLWIRIENDAPDKRIFEINTKDTKKDNLQEKSQL